jgi:hypothetical protein
VRANIRDYGAVAGQNCDLAFAAALAAAGPWGEVYVPATTGRYIVTTMQPQYPVRFVGDMCAFDDDAGSRILGTNGQDVFAPQSAGFIRGIEIENMTVIGGRNGLVIPSSGGINVNLRKVAFSTQQESGIKIEQWIERSNFETVHCVGSQYGFRLMNTGNPYINYMDKTTFLNLCRMGGSINGFRVQASRVCESVSIRDMKIDNCGQGGMWLEGNMRHWIVDNLYTENNCNLQPGIFDDITIIGGYGMQPDKFRGSCWMIGQGAGDKAARSILLNGYCTLIDCHWSKPLYNAPYQGVGKSTLINCTGTVQ